MLTQVAVTHATLELVETHAAETVMVQNTTYRYTRPHLLHAENIIVLLVKKAVKTLK